MRTLLAFLLLAPVASAADFPQPEKTTPDEPLAKTWSVQKAAAYLDGVGVNWTRERKCVTCHTNLPYIMVRPTLKGDDAGWKEVRKFLEEETDKWAKGEKPRRDGFVVVTAAGLAFSDAAMGKLHPATKTAFDKMWSLQQENGAWNWLKCDWPPMEHDDYYGTAFAALAVGSAPEKYASSDAAKAGVEKLKAYLRKTPPPDLHHKVILLWASTKLDGLLTADEHKKVGIELLKMQHEDGGWSLPSLGTYFRRPTSPSSSPMQALLGGASTPMKARNDANAPSDGYATGLAVYVLRQAGLAADEAPIKKGVSWLKANQRESGRWYTRSLNNDKAHYITNAGTAMAVLALAACGEPVALASR